MAELTQKYFDAGLNQAEFAELEALLEASPEAALRFSERALAEYASMGLPVPKFRRRLVLRQFRWPLALFFSAGAAWAFWPGHQDPRPDLSQPGVSFSVAHHVDAEEPEVLTKEPLQQVPRLKMVAMPAPPAMTLQGSRLGVVVKQAEAGQVLVSVRDGRGLELRRLFEGELKPGQWRFEWNGRLDDGRSAAPGTYAITVKRGSDERSQFVTLRQPAN